VGICRSSSGAPVSTTEPSWTGSRSPAVSPTKRPSSRTVPMSPAVSPSVLRAPLRAGPGRGPAESTPGNRRRIVRALEVTLGSGRPFSSFGPGLVTYGVTSSIIIGLELDRPELDRRLAERFEDELARGLLEEVRALSTKAGRVVADGPSGDRLPGAPSSRRGGCPTRGRPRPSRSAGCGPSPAGKRPGSSATREWSGSGPIGAIFVRQPAPVSATPSSPRPCDTDERADDGQVPRSRERLPGRARWARARRGCR